MFMVVFVLFSAKHKNGIDVRVVAVCLLAGHDGSCVLFLKFRRRLRKVYPSIFQFSFTSLL